jgi:NAD(P)-dependent dehydrogenase (short-subunit alcohol dehydrogenase family)
LPNTFGKESTTDDVLLDINLEGKRVLVTGVSSGLGLETARALASHGAHVVGAVRDSAKAQDATEEVRKAAAAGGGKFELIEIDLGAMASVRAGADALHANNDFFDIVIANAGILATPFELTSDGFERQFATNYLGHFVLINRISGIIRDGGRVVMLSTVGHQQSDVDLDDPNFERQVYDPFIASARSKTAVVQFAVEFDRRHKARGVRATAVHPGGIATGIARNMTPAELEKLFAELISGLSSQGRELEMKSVSQGAATTVWAAVVAPAEEIGGKYCEDCHVSKVLADDEEVGVLAEGVRSYALDHANAKALWKKSEEMVGETF